MIESEFERNTFQTKMKVLERIISSMFLNLILFIYAKSCTHLHNITSWWIKKESVHDLLDAFDIIASEIMIILCVTTRSLLFN